MVLVIVKCLENMYIHILGIYVHTLYIIYVLYIPISTLYVMKIGRLKHQYEKRRMNVK